MHASNIVFTMGPSYLSAGIRCFRAVLFIPGLHPLGVELSNNIQMTQFQRSFGENQLGPNAFRNKQHNPPVTWKGNVVRLRSCCRNYVEQGMWEIPSTPSTEDLRSMFEEKVLILCYYFKCFFFKKEGRKGGREKKETKPSYMVCMLTKSKL